MLSSPIGLIQSVPPITRAFTATTIIASGVYAYMSWKGLGLEAAQYMTMAPGWVIYSPWSIFTSVFVETTIFEVGFVSFCLLIPNSFQPVYCINDLCPTISQVSRKVVGKH